MRFDQVSIRLEPLNASNCLDLGVLFLAKHFKAVVGLVGTFAIPCCAAVYYLTYQHEYDVRLPLLLFYVVSSPLGVLLTIGAASAAFGEPFTWPGLLKQSPLLTLRLVFQGLLIRGGTGIALGLFFLDDWPVWFRVLLGFVLCLFPGLWLALRTGFFVERGALRNLSHHLHDTRGSTLIRKQRIDLISRFLMNATFCGLLWVTVFVALDFAINFLFHIPIFFPRVGPDGEIGFLLWGDPKVLTLLLGSAFFVYPFGRLGWFFCYIDLRVRQDCWDIELELTREAERLEASA